MKNFSVCVFCGSRSGDNPDYVNQAEKLGALIAKSNWRLVYGAGNTGIMGAIAKATQKEKGKTFGVIPDHLVQREVCLLYTSPSPRDVRSSRMPSSA